MIKILFKIFLLYNMGKKIEEDVAVQYRDSSFTVST